MESAETLKPELERINSIISKQIDVLKNTVNQIRNKVGTIHQFKGQEIQPEKERPAPITHVEKFSENIFQLNKQIEYLENINQHLSKITA